MILTRLTRISATLATQLLSKSLFFATMPRRDPSIPTIRDQTIKPFKIEFLYNNKGSRRYPKKLGRGPGSGKGKFAARGMKGQKARAGGGVNISFEGGQTPIHRRLPKYGRVKRVHAQEFYNTVNMNQLDYFIQKGIIKKEQPITIKTLNDVGLVKKVKVGVKILGKGAERITYPIHLQVTDASKSVIQAVQAAGGSVKLIHRTPLKLRQHMYPEKFLLPLRDPITPAWQLRKLERKSKDRGVEVSYVKPQWKIEEEKQLQELKASGEYSQQNKFVYPVPHVPNPDRIRIRKPKLYKKISYNL